MSDDKSDLILAVPGRSMRKPMDVLTKEEILKETRYKKGEEEK